MSIIAKLRLEPTDNVDIMSQKNNFRKTWKTLAELGEKFGISAVKFGNLLKQHGLREKTGEPSEKAKEGQFFEKIVPKEGKPYYLRHRQKTSDYLISLGVAKSGVSALEVESMTEARKLARSYLEAQKFDEQGDKMGYLMFDELVPEIKKLGLEKFNKALKSVGYHGSEVTLEDS